MALSKIINGSLKEDNEQIIELTWSESYLGLYKKKQKQKKTAPFFNEYNVSNENITKKGAEVMFNKKHT